MQHLYLSPGNTMWGWDGARPRGPEWGLQVPGGAAVESTWELSIWLPQPYPSLGCIFFVRPSTLSPQPHGVASLLAFCSAPVALEV